MQGKIRGAGQRLLAALVLVTIRSSEQRGL
jgi:hypothetical protein